MTKTPTREDLKAEWNYIYNERLAILGCFSGVVHPELEAIARRDADEAVRRMAEGGQGELNL